MLLFKISLLQTWYDLSDYEVEDRVNDSISLSYFCGLYIDQVASDHSMSSRFRTIMTKAKAYEITNLEDVLDTTDLPNGIPLKSYFKKGLQK